MAAPTFSPTPSPRRALIRPALFVVLVAAVIAVTWLAPADALDEAERGLLWLRAHNTFEGRAALTAALVLFAVLVPVLAWWRSTGRGRPVRLPEGRGKIALDDLANWLRDTVQMRHDVRVAEVHVENLHRRGVRVSALLHVTPDARLAETTTGTQQAIDTLLRSQVGVRPAGTPQLEVHYEELVLRAPARSVHA